jgi:hypothetical protein
MHKRLTGRATSAIGEEHLSAHVVLVLEASVPMQRIDVLPRVGEQVAVGERSV